jgi:hypothetical protein
VPTAVPPTRSSATSTSPSSGAQRIPACTPNSPASSCRPPAGAWHYLTDPAGAGVRFEQDHYLKLWQLTRPRLPGDYLLLDEAKDTNPILESVIAAQHGRTQIILVGDSAQRRSTPGAAPATSWAAPPALS